MISESNLKSTWFNQVLSERKDTCRLQVWVAVWLQSFWQLTLQASTSWILWTSLAKLKTVTLMREDDADMSLTWAVLGWRCHCSCHCHGLRCHDDQWSESRSSSTQRAQWPPRQWEAARGQVDTLTAAQTCKLGGVRMFGIADWNTRWRH